MTGHYGGTQCPIGYCTATEVCPHPTPAGPEERGEGLRESVMKGQPKVIIEEWQAGQGPWDDESIEVRRILAPDGRMLLVVGPFTGPAAASPAPDTGAEERLALLRIFDMTEDRPDIRSVARAALHDSASSGTREEGT